MQRTKTKHIKEKIGLVTYYRLMGLPFDSDPIKSSSITTEIDFNKLDSKVRKVIPTLPLVKFTGRFDYGGLDKRQQFYIMTTLKDNYIVDTQGTNYAKYVCRIINIPDISHKDVEAVFHSNEDIKMIKRSEWFKVVYKDTEYNIEITEEDEDTFISVEYNGNYVMDSRIEKEVIKYFNKFK
jgi:hypothetical protein